MKRHASKLSIWLSLAAMLCAMLLFSAFVDRPPDLFTYGSNFVEYTRVASWPDDMIDFDELNTRVEGLELEGRIPILNQYAGLIQVEINNEINRVRAAKVADARSIRARTLTFDYEIYFSDPYMSIILKSTAASAASKTEVISINFDIHSGELISAADVIGYHIVQLADRLLVEMIRRNPERFNPGFTGMHENQAFSLTDSEIIFWFNEFQLAPSFEGIVPLSLKLENIREITLSSNEFHVRPGGFNFKMVPIKRIVEALGYTLIWNPETRGSSIYLNDELIIEIFPEVNDYLREQRFTRSLEAAPVIIGYNTYVPISFFDQILSLVAYSIDDSDNITFASYLVTDEWFER